VNQKKSSRNWLFRIQDILNAINKIQRFTAEMTFEQFEKNAMAIDAVIRNFEIIGEAANHIPVKIQQEYPQVPWRQMISMRNSLIHEYFGADNSVVWETIQDYLPGLKDQLLMITAEHPLS
jgi:uncharacterized protein with HEPN domain